jgi:hypothetical protein
MVRFTQVIRQAHIVQAEKKPLIVGEPQEKPEKPDDNAKFAWGEQKEKPVWEKKSGGSQEEEKPKPKLTAKMSFYEHKAELPPRELASVKTSHVSAQVTAAAEAKAEVGIQTGDEGVGVYGKVEGKAGIEANGRINYGPVDISGVVFVGTKGEVAEDISVSDEAVTVSANAEAFFGESFEGKLKFGDDTASVQAGGEVKVGIGLTGGAKVEMGWEKTEAKVHLGAALGIGGSFNFTVSVSPKKIFSSIWDFVN